MPRVPRGEDSTDDALDRAALTGVLAGQHDDGCRLGDLGYLGRPAAALDGHHSTSGASDTTM